MDLEKKLNAFVKAVFKKNKNNNFVKIETLSGVFFLMQISLYKAYSGLDICKVC